jgi:hypothetical protein
MNKVLSMNYVNVGFTVADSPSLHSSVEGSSLNISCQLTFISGASRCFSLVSG